MADRCTAVGLLPQVLTRYAALAAEDLDKGHEPPVFSTLDLQRAIEDVKAQPGKVCADPELAFQAAMIVGYVEQVEAIDPTIPLADRQWRVLQDHQRFQALASFGATAGGLWKEGLAQVEKDVAFVTDQFFADHDFTHWALPATQPAVLKSVTDAIAAVRKLGKTPVVVVDLDDTVLNPATRTMGIVREFALAHLGELQPCDAAVIQTISADSLGYSATADLESRWHVADRAFLGGLQTYWFTKFFTNEHVVKDTVYPGAPAYVQSLKTAGATIVYLTGRHLHGTKPGTEPGMKDGTLHSLKTNGFPVPDGAAVRIIMKAEFDTKDVEYKRAMLPQIEALGVPVAVLDNEPLIDNMFVTNWPQAIVVRIGRTRGPNPVSVNKPDGTPRAPLLQDIVRPAASVQWIQDFRTNGTSTVKQ